MPSRVHYRLMVVPIVLIGVAGLADEPSLELRLRGYVQADGRFLLDDDEEQTTDSFLLRRVRPILEGSVAPDFGFRVMPDFGNGKSELMDAYGEYRAFPQARLKVGKFKPPFGLERLQSGADIRMIERGHPTSLAPNRDIGVALSGMLGSGVLSYGAGLFNGVPDGGSADSDHDDGKEAVVRLFTHPLQGSGWRGVEGVGLGVAMSAGSVDGSARSTGLGAYKSPGQQTFFSYRSVATNETANTYADGSRVRLAPQATYTFGPLGVLAEYTVSEQDVRRLEEEATLAPRAWQLLLSWVVTGEDNGLGAVIPAHPFNPAAGAWGAFELVGRVGGLEADKDAFPVYADPARSAASVFSAGAGINWYLSGHVKAAMTYERSTFDGGAPAGRDRADEHALLARLQVAF